MPTHVVAVVLFIQLSLPLIEVSISFVHPWVSALAQCRILLMVLRGSGCRDFTLQMGLMVVQGVHYSVALVQKRVRSPTIEQGGE